MNNLDHMLRELVPLFDIEFVRPEDEIVTQE